MHRGVDPEDLRPLRTGTAGELDSVGQDRLEQAVETIGIEIERIAEGQRFLTKLLSERGSTDAATRSTPRSPMPGSLKAPVPID